MTKNLIIKTDVSIGSILNNNYINTLNIFEILGPELQIPIISQNSQYIV